MIHSAFIRHRKQRESEQRSVREREREAGEGSEVESTFIRADSIRFRAAFQEIRLECVVIPLGSSLYPASFTTLPRLSSSMRASLDQ